MYENKANDQLRAAYLILGYTPISHAFQVPKCVIKAKDPRLHRISVAYKRFMVPEGIPIPEDTPFTQPLPVATLSVRISSSPPVLQEEGEGEEEGFVDLTDSLDEFEVFNQPSFPKSLPEEMGIQRRPQKSLMELIEDQPGRGGPGKLAPPKLSPPLPKSPPPAPQPTLLSRTEQADLKRKGEQKGKDVMETGDLVPLAKRRLNELRSSKKLAKYLAEVRKGQIFSPQSPKLAFQHLCLVVSP